MEVGHGKRRRGGHRIGGRLQDAIAAVDIGVAGAAVGGGENGIGAGIRAGRLGHHRARLLGRIADGVGTRRARAARAVAPIRGTGLEVVVHGAGATASAPAPARFEDTDVGEGRVVAGAGIIVVDEHEIHRATGEELPHRNGVPPVVETPPENTLPLNVPPGPETSRSKSLTKWVLAAGVEG